MADRATAEKWLVQLANLPTASGREDAVIAWIRAWVRRREDLRLTADGGGNLLITRKGRKRRAPILAVAHMDHPGFVITARVGPMVEYEFRGGVRSEYFEGVRVELFGEDGTVVGEIVEHDAVTNQGRIRLRSAGEVRPGDIGRWRLAKGRSPADRLRANACDDLAGCAAALAALDRARSDPGARHFGVLLTRAEEMGFVGAIHAAKSGTVPPGTRLISVETSRASDSAPVGGGPVVRVGDASTVFDQELTNLIASAASGSGLVHQRELMSGGSCEATAFGVYGHRAAALCLPLGNYHNMGRLDQVEQGRAEATPMLEEIALSDFHGLVDLLLVAVGAIDGGLDLRHRLDSLYERSSHLLG